MVERLFLAVPQGCLRFVIVVFPEHTHLLFFYMLDFFCSGNQLYLLLNPYLCFISFLYLDLYVLGDDALIS